MKTSIQVWKNTLMVIMMLSCLTFFAQTQREIVFTEDFESGWGNWYADNGVWQIGMPTVGPDNAHSGQDCAGTVLDGNYPNSANTRLISPEIILPNISEGEQVKLKFWQWYLMNNNPGDYDYGYVQISLDDGSTWETVAGNYDEYSGVWTQAYINLSAYANSTILLAFYFSSSDSEASNGWYIDDVSIEVAPVVFHNPEDFELGIGDWSADNGLWEIGVPTIGPASTHSGQNCAGTVLDGNYFNSANTRLVSPQITLPGISEGEQVKLKFWQWYLMNNNPGDYDYGYVQISLDDGTTWETVAGNYDEYSGVWTQAYINLSAYANSTILLAFYFSSSDSEASNGWYIDDVSIEVAPVVFHNPEDFELGIGDWSADNGLWEIGVPTIGPASTHSGQNCAGTVLDGNYFNSANTRLVSPQIKITAENGQNPRLFFWHWYRMNNNPGDYDYGVVQISTDDGASWNSISGDFDEYSPVWSQVSIPLTDYRDSIVRIGWYFISSDSEVDNGWYIDDVRIEGVITGIEKPATIVTPELILNQNCPNPFTHQTNIQYSILKDETVQLSIYNINGELIKILAKDRQQRGDYSPVWDGKNENNTKVSPGIYFYELKTENRLIRKKMLLLK